MTARRRAGGVVMVTRNLPPLLGGMERLNLHVALELARGFALAVVGPCGSAAALVGTPGSEVPIRPLWSFMLRSAVQVLLLACRRRPAVVLAGSGLTAPLSWIAARLCGARCVVYLHGLDMIVLHRLYQALWMPLIRRHDLCIVNSGYSRTLALAAGIPEASIRVLNPGVALPQGPVDVAAFRRRYGLEDHRLLLYVGRLTPRKGLLEFVQSVLPQMLRDDPSVRLVVVGEEASNALAGSTGGYRELVQAAAQRAGMAHTLMWVGACSDEVLAQAYAAAEVMVFPAIDRPGDAEGFGMVAIEAAAHGTPTVAFSVGGIPDAVQDGVSGILVQPGDYAAFGEALRHAARALTSPAARDRCRQFAAGYRWEAFGERLRALIVGLHQAGGRA